LAAAAARVVVDHPRTPELATAAVADIQAAGGAVLAAADISDRDQYQTMVERLLSECGRWDVLGTMRSSGTSQFAALVCRPAQAVPEPP
jgi:3-oxoacyl-[acyl-carrier protein] reductase